jgi:hypothetical protein
MNRLGAGMTRLKKDTTLGDLIVALTDETGRFVRDEKEVYALVAYIVSDLCRSRMVSKAL